MGVDTLMRKNLNFFSKKSFTYIKAAFFITVHGLIENLSPYYYKSRFKVEVDTLMENFYPLTYIKVVFEASDHPVKPKKEKFSKNFCFL